MKKAAIYALLITIFYSCGSNDRGELVGVKAKKKWFSEKPYGMALIPGGSFTMGKQDEDIIGTMSTPTKTVTVRPYYMDETEITNSEYKELVFWARDSIIRTLLADKAAEELQKNNGGNTATTGNKRSSQGIQAYAYQDVDTSKISAYQKYQIEKSDNPIRPLDWSEDLISLKEIDDMDMTQLLKKLLNQNFLIKCIPIDGNWLEIDTESDLNKYENCRRIFKR